MATKYPITETETTYRTGGIDALATAYTDGTHTITLVHLANGGRGRRCGVCSGTGHLPYYNHVEGGRCFPCEGCGMQNVWGTPQQARAYVTRWMSNERRKVVKAEADRLARQEAWRVEQAAFLEWIEEHGDFAAKITCAAPRNDFLASLRDEYLLRDRIMSDKQIAAAKDALAKIAENEATAHYGNVGDKVTLYGTIQHTSYGENDYGLYYMVIVEGAGDFAGHVFKMSGTAKCLIELQGYKGDEVFISATVKDHRWYKGVAQTIMTRPKLLEHTPAFDNENWDDKELAGTLDVQFVGSWDSRVYPVGGTKDAHKLLQDLFHQGAVHAELVFMDATWNVMRFDNEDVLGPDRSGKYYSLLDRSNVHYEVERDVNHVVIAHRTVKEQKIMREWYIRNGELQVHMHKDASCDNCRGQKLAQWTCGTWAQLAGALEPVEKLMMDAGMPSPWGMRYGAYDAV